MDGLRGDLCSQEVDRWDNELGGDRLNHVPLFVAVLRHSLQDRAGRRGRVYICMRTRACERARARSDWTALAAARPPPSHRREAVSVARCRGDEGAERALFSSDAEHKERGNKSHKRTAKLIANSVPALAVVTSSLKCFIESAPDSETATTSPFRSSLSCEFRLTTPSFTRHPATGFAPPIENVCSTSALPMIVSFTTGGRALATVTPSPSTRRYIIS